MQKADLWSNKEIPDNLELCNIAENQRSLKLVS